MVARIAHAEQAASVARACRLRSLPVGEDLSRLNMVHRLTVDVAVSQTWSDDGASRPFSPNVRAAAPQFPSTNIAPRPREHIACQLWKRVEGRSVATGRSIVMNAEGSGAYRR